jgi:predicted short-subunit dehydrogenase-like oxidoreductase (DUF2520 family)
MADNVVIVGPGRMGLALGAALRQEAVVERLTYQGRALEPPPHPLFDMGAERGAEYHMAAYPLPSETTVLVLAVPDAALGEVAYDFARLGPAPAGCAALHLSGALSTDALVPLHGAGFAVGSMHPLQAVADPWSAGDRLVGSAFAVAGEPVAVSAARRLVDGIGGRMLVVPAALRPLYHAAAVFASNYFIALLAVAVRLLQDAGVSAEDALPAILPLARGTLDNVQHLGVPAALTGPIARGDGDTIRLHLARLSGDDRELYCALGRELLPLARAAGLDERRIAELQTLLTP